MNQDIHSFDHVENLLLGMMEAADLVTGINDKENKKKKKIHSGNLPGTYVLRNETMKPHDAYTFDATSLETDDDHRLYTTHPDYLVRPAWETLGDHAEVVLINSNTQELSWMGFRKRRSLPKGVISVGHPHVIYEHHCRMQGGEGAPLYVKDIVAFNSKGQMCPIFYTNANKKEDNKDVFRDAVVAASLMEDARRSDAFLASVFDHMIVRFPVGIGAHKDFFFDREAPMTPRGRRKAILHWVKQHQRRNTDKVTEAYTRGVKEITMDGIRVTLESF